MANPFTGALPVQSQVIRTDAEIMAQAKRDYEEQYARQMASYQQKLAAQDASQSAAAQTLVDQITAMGGLSWNPVERFAYGEYVNPDTLAPGSFDESGNYAQYYALDPTDTLGSRDWRNGGTQYGSIEGGSNWIPTVDEARALLDAWAENPRMNLTPMTGTYQTPQDIIRNGLGNDVAPEWVNYLAAQTQFKDPTQGDALYMGASNASNFLEGGGPIDVSLNATLQPMSDPFLYGRSSTLNPARDALDSLLAGVIGQQPAAALRPDGMNARSLQNIFNVERQAPQNQWEQVAAGLQQKAGERAQSGEMQTDAYNRYTLGNNYLGGIINENYAQPFGGRLEGYDQNNPLSYFGWDGSRIGGQQGGMSYAPAGARAGGPFSGNAQRGGWMSGQQQPWGNSGWGGPWGGGL